MSDCCIFLKKKYYSMVFVEMLIRILKIIGCKFGGNNNLARSWIIFVTTSEIYLKPSKGWTAIILILKFLQDLY